MNLILFLALIFRRIVSGTCVVTTLFVICKTFQRKRCSANLLPLYFCFVEWAYREIIYRKLLINNPFAHVWEARTIPSIILLFGSVCAILNKTSSSGGILQAMKRLMRAFFNCVASLKIALVKIYENPNLKWIESGLIMAALISAIISIVTASKNSLGVYIAGGFLLLFYAGYFIHWTLCSARRLLWLWLGGTTLFGLIASATSEYLANLNHLSSDYAFWLSYLCFTAFFVFGWIITACLAEEKAAKLASSFVIAITTIATIVGNVFLIFVQQAFSNGPDGLNAAIAVLVNLILLPVLSASLLASFFIDLQTYCMAKEEESP